MGSCLSGKSNSAGKLYISPCLLIDGFQREHASKQYIVTNVISNIILNYYSLGTTLYSIGHRYDRSIRLKTKIDNIRYFDSINPFNIKIHSNGQFIVFHQHNGQVIIFKNRKNTYKVYSRLFNIRDISLATDSSNIMLIVSNDNPHVIKKDLSLTSFNKVNLIQIMIDDKNISQFWCDYNSNTETVFILDNKGILIESSEYSFKHILSPQIRIKYVVSNNGNSFFIDTKGIVYCKGKNINDPYSLSFFENSVFNYNSIDTTVAQMFRGFWKDKYEYIAIQKIVLSKHGAIALDNDGFVYVWGDVCGSIISEPKKLIAFASNESERVDAKYVSISDKQYYENDIMVEIKYDDITSGMEHCFIVSNNNKICIGWGNNNYQQLYLFRNVCMEKRYCNNNKRYYKEDEYYINMTRMSDIEWCMKFNKFVRVYAVEHQTYIIIQS
eukprot:105197_1